jgi:hypothetical protein
MANEHHCHYHYHYRGPRTRRLRAVVALGPGIAATAACLLASGCGGNSPRPTTASPSIAAQALAFSRCMRSHGVPNYPDPSGPNGEGKLASNSGINFSSPAFKAAQSACQKPAAGGPRASGSPAEIRSQFLAFSRCMRAHGITDFPDPTTSPPPPAPGRTVSNNGVYLLIPITMNVNSPTYESAAAACRPHSG